MALPHALPTRTDAAMTSSHTPAPRCQWFSALAKALDPRSGRRLAVLFLGLILARGRRTVSSWVRAAGEGERDLIRVLRERHYEWRTEQAYRMWARRFGFVDFGELVVERGDAHAEQQA